MAQRKPGKYDGILHKLPKLPVELTPGETVGYQDKVEQVKDEIRHDKGFDLTAVGLGKEYASLRAEKDEAKAQLSAVNLRLEAVTQMLIASQEQAAQEEVMDGWGQYGASVNSLRLVSGDVLRVQPEPYVIVEDRDTFRDWCIEKGMIRSLMLPWTTTNSLTKERLLNGEGEPPGTKAYIKTSIVFTAMKEDKS